MTLPTKPDPSALTYYAHKYKSTRGGAPYYMHASPEFWWVEIHGCPEPIVKLRLRERQPADPPSECWGWLDAKDPTVYQFVQPCEAAFHVCFPYGPDAEEAAGKGRQVNLIVEETHE